MYALGQSVPQNYAQAATWLRKATEQGDVDGQYNLGLIYANGQGVPQDYAQAISWLRKAAYQGHSLAQAGLGSMYANGQGVAQDYVQAHMSLNLAAAGARIGEVRETASKARDEVAAKMTPAQIAEAQQMAREWKPN
jgi:TPR repeat protein